MNNDERRAPRVAVIAVHGVADQVAGFTARAVAELLVASGSSSSIEYAITSSDDIGIRVTTLPPTPHAAADAPSHPQASPAASVEAKAQPMGHGNAASPAAAENQRPLAKAFVQSVSSDFHREQWVPQGRRMDHAAPAMTRSAEEAPLSNPGIALTDFLLFKAQHNDGSPPTVAAYDTVRLNLQRTDHAQPQQPPVDVHLYEMYWADLSRLARGVPRLLTELFTMLFRLSQLGRDTVRVAARQFDTAESPHVAWRWLARLQTLLDWAFCKGLALLMLQLLMLTLIIVPMGLAAQVPGFAESARKVAAAALPALALLWALYRLRKTVASMSITAASLAALVALLWLPPAHWVVGGVWLTLLCLAYDWGMRVCDERFPLTRLVGLCMWGIVLSCVVATAVVVSFGPTSDLYSPMDLHIWVVGALRAVELALLATVIWWGGAGIALFGWLAAGQAVSSSSGFEGRASVATGRLALFTSLGSFVILVMAGWAALRTLLSLGTAKTSYVPAIFGPPEAMPAQLFLEQRYLNSTEAFSVVALLVMVLLGYLLLTFLPSLLAEMKVVKTDGARLGRWLTFGYRYMDLSVMVIVVLAVLAAIMAGTLLVAARFHTDLFARLNEVVPGVSAMSQQFLKPLIISTASAMVALSVLGGLLSRYVPWLRAPLDVALDVDNHFREFPRHAIPRARIFARYFALLRHVAQQDYDRVVIVAHSQGTVISAELLRYLTFRAGQAKAGDAVAQTFAPLQGKLHLLTAGCPLRQLYASRFPTLYHWALHHEGATIGPSPAHVGVQRWINTYTTGDYIGRWLWSRPAQAGSDVSEALVDQSAHDTDLYQRALLPEALAQLETGARQMDVCLGPGAHTHYFEPDQRVVAQLIDRLIVSEKQQRSI